MGGCKRIDGNPCGQILENTGVGAALLIDTVNPNEIKGLTSLDSSVVITDNTTTIDLSVSTPVADTNIYDIDGILVANRTLTGNNFDLNFLGLNSFTLTGQDSHSISTSGAVIQLQNTNTTGLIQLITTQNTSNISVVSAGDLEAYGYSVSNFGRNALSTLTNVYGADVRMPGISNLSTSDILYYNSVNGSITYGAAPVISVNTIYTANDSLISNRTISGASSYSINFNQMTNIFFSSSNGISLNCSGASGNISVTTSGLNSSIVINAGGNNSNVYLYASTTNIGRSSGAGPYTTNIYGQNLYLRNIASATTSNILYYNSASKLVTYAPAPTIPSYVCFNYASTSTASITGLFPAASDTTMIGSIINQVDFTSVSGGSEVQYNGATSKGFRLKFSASVIQTVPANQEIRVSLILNGATPISTTLTRTYNPGLSSGYFYIACLETIQFLSTGQRIGVGWGRQTSNTALNINNATLIIESI